MANNLKPTRQKLHKYFAKSRHSASESELADWDANDLSSFFNTGSMQMGTLANPEVPISPVVVKDSTYKPSLVAPTVAIKPRNEPKHGKKFQLHYDPEPFVFDSFLAAPQQAPPPPPPIPQPDRLPPPPPLSPLPEFPQPPELPSFLEPPQPRVRRAPSVKRPRPASGIRRAKTPVRQIGQLEMAAAKKRQEAAINRQSSVRTIARQYRTLIDKTDIPDVPSVPSIHRKPLPNSAAPHINQFTSNDGPIPRLSIIEPRSGGSLDEPKPRCELAPWPESDADTLVSSPDISPYVKPLEFSSPPTPPAENGHCEDDHYEDDDYIKSPDTETLRFQIGFEMLTRELSSGFADRSSRAGRGASGLQIWVMIEAYEKLRDEISSMEMQDPELQCARAMFDSWLAALRAIQKTIANEGAESDSEYGDDDE
ncbi:mating-type switching protein swi10 [Metarhizium brunneum]